MRCPGYTGVVCINGSCPVANYEEYVERCYDVVHDCSECHYYEGCNDCYFAREDGVCEVDLDPVEAMKDIVRR